MKVLSLIAIFIFTSLCCQSQDTSGNRDVGIMKDSIGAFTKVEVDAQFQNGLPGWQKFLYANLDGSVVFKDLPKKTKQFKQTAIVQFIVCTDGSVCDVKVINDVLPSIKKEAERVINISSGWTPAQMNGRKVKAYKKQPITFVVSE